MRSTESMNRDIKKNKGYRLYREKQKRTLLLYVIINLILCSILLQFPVNDTVTLADFFFTAAALVSFIGLFVIMKKPKITAGTITGKKTDKRTGRIRYSVEDESDSLICYSLDGTEFETGEEVYIIGRTNIIKNEKEISL